jgi:small subunit ribosomal protein S17
MVEKERGRRKTLIGRVASDKMDKTVVVEVQRRLRHPVYKKFVFKKMRYMAHDKENDCHTGDRVEIREHRPLSKNKRWIVSRVVERAVLT